MIRKPLNCPTCGDTWKRVFNENFMRLGPPTHECRACWTSFNSGAKEWVDLDWSGRLGFFLQDLVTIAPFVLLLFISVGIVYLFNLAGPQDVQEFLWDACLGLLGLYALLALWSLLMVILSKRRVPRRASPPAATGPADERHLHYPQGRPNPRPKGPEEQSGRPL